MFDLINWVSKIFNPFLNPVLKPILSSIPENWAIVLMSLIITLVTTLVYKKFTNQEILKSLKQEIKDIQQEMKEFSHDIQRTKELQKKSWEKMIQQMKQSMKPMLVTWIPILIIFAWIWTNLAYYPILPGEEFTTTINFEKDTIGTVELFPPENVQLLSQAKKEISDNKASWNLKGAKGEYKLSYKFKDKIYAKDLVITDKKLYIQPKMNIFENNIKTIEVENRPVKIFGMNWFWGYLIISIIINSLLRKLLKIH
tara:strand:- start:33 stop:797 length:765 start_codon:yes stop_codon:yes gene_type:complete